MPGVAAPEFASIPCFSVSSLTATIVALSLSLSRSLYLSISPSSSFIYSSSAFLFSKLTLLSCLVTLYVLKFSLQHFLFVSWCHFLSFIISDFLSAFQRWSYSSFALFNYSLIVLVFFLLLFVTSFWLFCLDQTIIVVKSPWSLLPRRILRDFCAPILFEENNPCKKCPLLSEFLSGGFLVLFLRSFVSVVSSMMSSMANLARIGILAGSAALVSMEANVFYSRNDGASECRKVLDIWKNARAIRRYRVYNCSVYIIVSPCLRCSDRVPI